MGKDNSDTLKQQVYDDLFSDIINGVYPPDSILTEKTLIEKYNVSRAPIREALMQLTTTHLVSSIPRQGYKILRLSRKQLLEIVKFRSTLECSFLQNSADYISQQWIDELRDFCHEYLNSPENDFMAHWRSNCKFHLRLFSISGNQYAYHILENALNTQTFFFVNKNYRPTMDLHFALLDYLEKGEINTAVSLLKADIESLLVPVMESPLMEGKQDKSKFTPC